jgi:hypothetical protein
MSIDDFDVDSISNDLSFFLKFVVLTLVILSEAKLLAHSDSLSAGELHHGSSEGFLGMH